MGDDDWELFVPVIGERYPEGYQFAEHGKSKWHGGSVVHIKTPRNDVYQYRKPKQKENKMPDRTPQQALKDAIDSGAVDAWINGEDIQYRVHGSVDRWIPVESPHPDFALHGLEYRPKPPEPTKINWRPVVTGKEPKGVVLGYWGPLAIQTAQYCVGRYWGCPETQIEYATPTHWAPMCNLPEEK